MIDLKQLINVAPYPDDTRAEILSSLPSLSEEKKEEIRALSWDLIIEWYETKVSFEMQEAIEAVAQGKPAPTPQDFERIEQDILNELIQKLDAAQDNEKIQELREKIQSAKVNPQ